MKADFKELARLAGQRVERKPVGKGHWPNCSDCLYYVVMDARANMGCELDEPCDGKSEFVNEEEHHMEECFSVQMSRDV
jgi:hypothetical protein